MSLPRSMPEARVVDKIEALMTVEDAGAIDDFLARCVPGSVWTAQIRTAAVAARVLARNPLGSFDERVCTCVRLRLNLPVPVEPGLRFHLVAQDDDLTATGVVRPWGG